MPMGFTFYLAEQSALLVVHQVVWHTFLSSDHHYAVSDPGDLDRNPVQVAQTLAGEHVFGATGSPASPDEEEHLVDVGQDGIDLVRDEYRRCSSGPAPAVDQGCNLALARKVQ